MALTESTKSINLTGLVGVDRHWLLNLLLGLGLLLLRLLGLSRKRLRAVGLLLMDAAKATLIKSLVLTLTTLRS